MQSTSLIQKPNSKSDGTTRKSSPNAGHSPDGSAAAKSQPIDEEPHCSKNESAATDIQSASLQRTRLKKNTIESETPVLHYSDSMFPSVLSPLSPDQDQSVLNRARSISFLNDEAAAAHLLSLRGDAASNPSLPTQETNVSITKVSGAPIPPVLFRPPVPGALDKLSDDGIFLHGSAYWELHSTLRNRIFSTAKSNAASSATTRHPTPDLDHSSDEFQISRTGSHTDGPRQDWKGSELLSQHVEYELWKNWIDEVAPWVSNTSFKMSLHV